MALNKFRRRLEPAIRAILHLYWRFSRPATLGARAVVIDAAGRVFLIRHSYVSGWHFPGGGVEAGESIVRALAREIREEGNIELTAPPVLHGIYFNRRASRRDHVALFIVRQFRQDVPPKPNYEIVGHGFFALDALPDDTSAGTRARLVEIFDGRPVSEEW